MARRRRTPVIVVAGFLGAGKTTLLNHLLHSPARLGVVVNDFGAVNVDAALVDAQVDATVAIGNGCLCCATDAAGLADLLDVLAARPLDAVVIEASGLAEPGELVRMVRSVHDPRLRPGGLVMVVDAGQFAESAERWPVLLGHLRAADLVVLNKADRADDLDALRAQLREIVADRPVLACERGRVPVGLLVEYDEADDDLALQPMLPTAAEHEHEHGCGHDHAEHRHFHEHWDTVTIQVEEPLAARAFAEYLVAMPGVHRVKGWVRLAGDEKRWQVSVVGSDVEMLRERSGGGTELVLIGVGLDEAALRAGVVACVDPAPEAARPESLDAVRRWENPSRR